MGSIDITPVVIISHDVVGPKMAGPGIRYWEMARVLRQSLPVVLAIPNPVQMSDVGVRLWPYQPGVWESIAPVVEAARVIVLCGDVLAWFPQLMEGKIPLVVDGYDPHPLETLALFAGMPEQMQRHQARERILQMQCQAGDFFLCASERQRDWWLGLLEATGRINAYVYNADPSLRQLLDVVPFGLPSAPPQHTKQVLKGVWSGIGPADKVVLWGGGLWQWLDPLTAIRAIARVREQRDDVRLVFPGMRHPNAAIPDMPMARQAQGLAAALDLLGTYVFFGEWVPHSEWPNYLLEADVGLSLHFDTLETRLAFRSRMLDYMWAGLPMVVTGGDATGDLVARQDLGRLVDFEDVEGVAQALLDVLAQPRATWEERFAEARAPLTWERAVEPLVQFCHHPCRITSWSAPWSSSTSLGIPEVVRTRLDQQEQELVRLRTLVAGYEQGRVMRLLRWGQQILQKRSQ
ncbi:MAG TPA: glycosyltransferase [Anaerolineae bacterium]|nr:glycosyltransferase [Anaerolineae bacterium]HQH38545.1 glycosyltransferase [Anaerolineae bacterium]